MSCSSWLQHATALICYSLHMVFSQLGPLLFSSAKLPFLGGTTSSIPFCSRGADSHMTCLSTILITRPMTKAMLRGDRWQDWVKAWGNEDASLITTSLGQQEPGFFLGRPDRARNPGPGARTPVGRAEVANSGGASSLYFIWPPAVFGNIWIHC